MSYVLFFLLAAATGLTARLIPAVVPEEGSIDGESSILKRYPLSILMGTWVVVFALLAVAVA